MANNLYSSITKYLYKSIYKWSNKLVCSIYHISVHNFHEMQYLYPHCKTSKNFLIYNIRCLSALQVLWQQNLDMVTGGTSWQCNIELSMRKHRSAQIKSNILDSLALGLVDSHSKCNMDWKLSSLQRNCKCLSRWFNSFDWWKVTWSVNMCGIVMIICVIFSSILSYIKYLKNCGIYPSCLFWPFFYAYWRRHSPKE